MTYTEETRLGKTEVTINENEVTVKVDGLFVLSLGESGLVRYDAGVRTHGRIAQDEIGRVIDRTLELFG
jgi:hypothetical protein